jgi:hypothetical protein
VSETGGRIGRLDAGTESGMFHKIDKAKLEKIKKTLRKGEKIDKGSTADPASSEEK